MDAHTRKVYVPMTETGFYILYCLQKENHGYGIVQMVEKRQGIKISAPEEIAYNMRWISREALLRSAEKYGKSSYGQHLRSVAEGRILYTGGKPGERPCWGVEGNLDYETD